MSDNVNNKKNKNFYKEIESDIILDEIKLNDNKNKNFSSIKKTPKNKIIKSNLLINTLQKFINKYDRKMMLKNKFLISFKELIYLISESILAQQKIDALIYNNNNINDNSIKVLNNIKIQKINQRFISDLSYNIFSLDKVDINNNFSIKNKYKRNNTNMSSNLNSKNQK